SRNASLVSVNPWEPPSFLSLCPTSVVSAPWSPKSSFSSFREISYDRIREYFRGGTRLGKILLRPAVESGYLWARIRYRVNLGESSPLEAIVASDVPVLLIHGTNDNVIPLRHSRILLGGRPRNTELWEAANAGHTEACATRPDEFERRVIGFFTEHAQQRANRAGPPRAGGATWTSQPGKARPDKYH